MGLVRNYRRCAWLVTYLIGASPALCRSFRPDGHELLTELDSATWYAPYATSLRMSDLGYRNKTQGRLSIRANSLAEYLAGIRSAVTTEEPRYAAIGVVVDGEYRQLNANILQIENEYYSTIRPKPSKASKSRPLVALAEARCRLRRGAHARFEQRRPRRNEPKRAALHRGAADLLPVGREPADLGRGAGRDRCARSHGRARRPAAGARRSSTRGASGRCASAGSSSSPVSATSPSCSTPTPRATSRPSTPRPRRCATRSERRRRRLLAALRSRASELFRVHAGARAHSCGLLSRLRARRRARAGAGRDGAPVARGGRGARRPRTRGRLRATCGTISPRPRRRRSTRPGFL